MATHRHSKRNKLGWFKISFPSKDIFDNKKIILQIIKPLIENLEDSGHIVNFFFLQYGGGNEPYRVTFTFYGRKKRVIKFLRNKGINFNIQNWDAYGQRYRFEKDYMLGIKMFEIGSRLALCRIDNRLPIDKKMEGANPPIFKTMRHAFLQNLGYGLNEENTMSQTINPDLLKFYNYFISINPK